VAKESKELKRDFEGDFEVMFSKSDLGQIQIGKDVIKRIAELAVGDVDGVELQRGSKLGKLLGAVKREEAEDGIQVDFNLEDNSVRITCFVRMIYGQDMYDLAQRLQRQIKENVEKMTRTIVRVVDVKVTDIMPMVEESRSSTPDSEEVLD
jgi:uncharacterized alkaline shock family protein YloU